MSYTMSISITAVDLPLERACLPKLPRQRALPLPCHICLRPQDLQRSIQLRIVSRRFIGRRRLTTMSQAWYRC